jgi:glycosyltransferase involved in cell wall biosynthesis
MNKPLVTVITPAYNVENYIANTIESVRNQTEQRFQYIIVDDGSTDKTASIAHELTLDDPRMSVHTQKNAGSSAARNTALAMAQGEYIAFVDGDDTWQPTFLEVMIHALEKHDATVRGVFASSILVNEIGEQVGQYKYPPGRYGLDKMLGFWCPPGNGSAQVLRRSAFDVGGFEEELRSAVDLEMWLRILDVDKRYAFVSVPEPLVRYMKRTQGSITSDGVGRLTALEILLGRYETRLSWWKRLNAYRRPILVGFRAGADNRAFALLRKTVPFGPVLYLFSRDGRRVWAYTVLRTVARPLEGPARALKQAIHKRNSRSMPVRTRVSN